MTQYITIKKFADATGYSEAAIRAKISRGVWPQNQVWIRAPDSRVIIDIQGYERWVAGRAEGAASAA